MDNISTRIDKLLGRSILELVLDLSTSCREILYRIKKYWDSGYRFDLTLNWEPVDNNMVVCNIPYYGNYRTFILGIEIDYDSDISTSKVYVYLHLDKFVIHSHTSKGTLSDFSGIELDCFEVDRVNNLEVTMNMLKDRLEDIYNVPTTLWSDSNN